MVAGTTMMTITTGTTTTTGTTGTTETDTTRGTIGILAGGSEEGDELDMTIVGGKRRPGLGGRG